MNRRSQKATSAEAGGRTAAESHAHSPSETKSMQELEAEIALYRHALEKSREEFQAFAYSVSHDLRAPLRAIEGFSKILLEDFAKELSEEPRRFLQHIISNTQHLGSQIEDLLKFYRAGKNAPTKMEVSADALCKEALVAVQDPSRPVEIVQEPLPKVHADPLQLREIFAELIGNALKYTSKTPSPRIEIGAKLEPIAVTFYVRDNGVGFEERAAGRLFQVFQKLHNPAEFPGNGIGLAIVKRLVEAHGGCLSANSQPGKGSVFCFSLPRDDRKLTEAPSCLAVSV
jgi:two-component system, sensor histidine kinase and response regulator